MCVRSILAKWFQILIIIFVCTRIKYFLFHFFILHSSSLFCLLFSSFYLISPPFFSLLLSSSLFSSPLLYSPLLSSILLSFPLFSSPLLSSILLSSPLFSSPLLAVQVRTLHLLCVNLLQRRNVWSEVWLILWSFKEMLVPIHKWKDFNSSVLLKYLHRIFLR